MTIRRTFSVFGPYAPDFVFTNAQDIACGDENDDLVYDPVYHKVISIHSKEFKNTNDTTHHLEGIRGLKGVSKSKGVL